MSAATWREHAACRGADMNMFFPARGESIRRAQLLCASCPVIEQCLDFGLSVPDMVGVFGGLSENERVRVRRRRRIAVAADATSSLGRMSGAVRVAPKSRDTCGSEAGYGAHSRHGERPCPACMNGHARYTAGRKAAVS